MKKLMNWVYDHLLGCYGVLAIVDAVDAYFAWSTHHMVSAWLDIIAVVSMLVLMVLVYRVDKKKKKNIEAKEEK